MSDSEITRTQPESLQGRSLAASLTVKDLATSLAFYRDVLGFTVKDQFERGGAVTGARLIAGDVGIMLNQDDGKQGLDRAKGVGMSLMITTAQRVDDIADRIRASGATLLGEPTDMPWGARVFRVADPDGYRLAFSSERPGA